MGFFNKVAEQISGLELSDKKVQLQAPRCAVQVLQVTCNYPTLSLVFSQ
jgi:hypothetical protein